MELKNLVKKGTSCKKLCMQLANQGIMMDRKAISTCLLEQGLKAYRSRKKLGLTQNMKQVWCQWAVQHEN